MAEKAYAYGATQPNLLQYTVSVSSVSQAKLDNKFNRKPTGSTSPYTAGANGGGVGNCRLEERFANARRARCELGLRRDRRVG